MTTSRFNSLQELFADERRWCQRTTFEQRGDVLACCLLGGLQMVYPGSTGEYSVRELQLRKMLRAMTGDPCVYISDYNDAPTRTIADIQALVKLANV